MNLSAVRIFVRELEPAKRFYQDVLGLHLTHDGSAYGYCTFQSSGIHVVVETVSLDSPEDEQVLVGRFAGLSFGVENIVSECTRLKEAGVEFTGHPEKQFWGGWLATFRDPAGNELQLAQYEA
jgi:catechol 2,3-dioxygenase-like lactoylglutathione lyase family enzyme